MSPGNVVGESSVHKKQIWVYRSSPPPPLTTTTRHDDHHYHHLTRPPPLDTTRVIQVNSSRSSQLAELKSWTSLGKHEKAFCTGLKKFVDDCKPLVDSAGNIKCPCKSCRLVLWVSIKHLADHISKYGFDPSYKTWIHHGEADLPHLPPVIDNIRQPQMSDMTACLNELSYIPLNNEQNEPTQGDIGETSNDPTQAKRNEFEELYASANEELYPGCDYVTRLDFMAKFTYFKAKEPRIVRLGLAADGFNPFSNLS
nr:hypothetical protein [Tanacetum cinerariifolium]